MRHIKKLVSHRKVRFGLVGIGNTLFNFVILNIAFFLLGQSKIVSGIIATLFALTLSFFLNRNFVFRHAGQPSRQALRFVLVTLTGVMLIQNVVYAFFVFILKDHTGGVVNLIHSLSGIQLSENFFDINVSNAIGSLCTMVWNYNGYRLFVFNEKTESHAVPVNPV